MRTYVATTLVNLLLPALCLAAVEKIDSQGSGLPPTWHVDAGERVEWCQFPAPGILVVRTKERLLGINVEDGRKIWELPANGTTFRAVSPTRFAFLVYEKGARGETDIGALLDLETGQERWSTEDFGMREIYCSLDLPPIQAVYLYGKAIEPKKDAVCAVRLLTGELIWKVIEPFKGWGTVPRDLAQFSPAPLFDTAASMLVFFSRKSIRRYNLADGALLWETSENVAWDRYDPYNPSGKELSESEKRVKDFRESPPGPRWGYAPMLLDAAADRFYAPFRNHLGAFRTSDGSLIWQKPPKFGSRLVCQMEATPQGMMVLTCDMPSAVIGVPVLDSIAASGAYALHLIDRETGQTIWSWPRKYTWASCTHFVVRDNQVFLAAEDKVRAMDPATGAERELLQLKLENVETATTLRALGDTLLLLSPQNALWCRIEGGATLRHTYAEPPSGWNDAGGLLATFLTIDALSTGKSRAIKNWWGQGGSGMWSDLSRDFSDSQVGADGVYMLLEGLDGPQLVAIATRNGDVVGRVALRDKEPRYQVNPYDSKALLYIPFEGTLHYYRF